jgi:hypothetical protein
VTRSKTLRLDLLLAVKVASFSRFRNGNPGRNLSNQWLVTRSERVRGAYQSITCSACRSFRFWCELEGVALPNLEDVKKAVVDALVSGQLKLRTPGLAPLSFFVAGHRDTPIRNHRDFCHRSGSGADSIGLDWNYTITFDGRDSVNGATRGVSKRAGSAGYC